jgi:nitroreductase
VEFTEVIKRCRMVRSFTDQPLAPRAAERLLRAANRAPSAGSSQGYSFLWRPSWRRALSADLAQIRLRGSDDLRRADQGDLFASL